jgi:hypothetical protein
MVEIEKTLQLPKKPIRQEIFVPPENPAPRPIIVPPENRIPEQIIGLPEQQAHSPTPIVCPLATAEPELMRFMILTFASMTLTFALTTLTSSLITLTSLWAMTSMAPWMPTSLNFTTLGTKNTMKMKMTNSSPLSRTRRH